MLIGIDASRAFLPKRTGTENYTWQLLLALAKLECEDTLRLYLRSNQTANLQFDPATIRPRVIDRGFLWTQLGLALETWRQPPDVLFIPAHVIPFFKNPRVPTVVTVHDLPIEFFPRQGNFLQWIYLSRLTEWVRAKLATHIIAVSEATKKDLVEKLGVAEKKISVIYEGVDYQKFQIPNSKSQINSKFQIQNLKTKYNIEGDYFLFVGTLQPRKNLVRLIEAFKFFIDSLPSSNSQLVISGKLGWDYEEILETSKNLGIAQRVKFLDYVPDEELPALYVGSVALVLPSLHEGFGLPILEAYAAGTLVVCSNLSSLPEVAGPYGIYINPLEVSDIAKGLNQAERLHFNDIYYYSERIEKQKEWAKKFSWDKTARQTLGILREVALRKP